MSRARDPRPVRRVALIAPMANFAMGHYIVLLAEGLRTAGLRVLVVTSEAFAYRTRLEGRGIEVVALRRRGGLGQVAAMLRPSYYRDALGAIARFRPGVVHILNGEGYPLGHLMALRYARRLVVTLHDPVPHTGSRIDRISRILSLPVLAAARVIHVHREAQRRFLASVAPWKRVAVAPHGSFAPLFDPPPFDAAKKEDLVLFWGRIEAYKGVDILAAALEGLDPKYRVVIAGVGDPGPGARAKIAAAARAEFRNRFIPDGELRDLLIRAKFAVFPYRSATQTSVPLLAAAFGVIPVMSPVATFRELVAEVDGVIMKDHSPEALAKAVNETPYREARLSGALEFGAIARRFADTIYPMAAR